jgi:hypothetical protein
MGPLVTFLAGREEKTDHYWADIFFAVSVALNTSKYGVISLVNWQTFRLQ